VRAVMRTPVGPFVRFAARNLFHRRGLRSNILAPNYTSQGEQDSVEEIILRWRSAEV
jgi:hypothetical protein